MLSIAGRTVSRSKLLMRVPLQVSQDFTLNGLKEGKLITLSNPQYGVISARSMSSLTPRQPGPDEVWQSADSSTDFTTDNLADFDSISLTDNLIETSVVSLQELGLGSYATPSGLLQVAMGSLHDLGLPWWGTIVAITAVMRVLTFPLMLRTQRATPGYMAMMSKMNMYQRELREAKRRGDDRALNKLLEEAKNLFQDYPRVSATMFLPAMIQAPVFVSFFLALTGMAGAPVESMKTGGALWFPDLTVMDPTYLLPAIASGSLLAIMEVGADVPIRTDQMKHTKIIMRIFPVVIFYVIMDYPAAVLCYWSTTNLLSLCQVYFLNMPEIRKKLNLPPLSEMRKTIG